jgi:hypothetical protein
MSWDPIEHRPPLKRIEVAPYTPAPQPLPQHIEQQLSQLDHMRRKLEGERIWGHVVDISRGG